MTTYEFKYELIETPAARTDGSTQVGHNIQTIFREAGSGDAWQVLPGHHKSGLVVPAAELQTALGSGTTQQKIAAYKSALASNLNSQAAPMNMGNWSAGQLQLFADANDESTAAQVLADEFITITLELTYPVSFNV